MKPSNKSNIFKIYAAFVAMVIIYLLAVFFLKDVFDWEKISYITVVFGVVGLLISLWQIVVLARSDKKDMILLEIEIGNEISNSSLVKYQMDDIVNVSSSSIMQDFRSDILLINKIHLLVDKGIIDFSELYIICGSKIKGLLIRLIRIYISIQPSDSILSEDFFNRYKIGLLNIYDCIKKIDTDILLFDDEIDQIRNMKKKSSMMQNIIRS